ncbi:MAG: DUF417 family protein [Tepidisphaeraceae bacterium]
MSTERMFTERTKLEFSSIGQTLAAIGKGLLRYGLVAVLLWVGALKFTAYEAANIKPLVENSPLMSWGYKVMSVQGFSILIGLVEITLGVLIAMRRISPLACAAGSLGAVGMLLITLTFVLSTPGVWEPGYGFPFPSGMPGQFLLKDLILLAAALWSAGDALHAAADEPRLSRSRQRGQAA